MADPTTNLRVRISAELAGFRSALGSMRGDINQFQREVSGGFNGLTSGLGKLRGFAGVVTAGLAGITAGATAAAVAVKSAVDRMDEIGESARSIGISTEGFSRLAFGAQFSGVQVDQLRETLLKFSRDLIKNEGLLDKLGINARDAEGNFRPIEQLVTDLADVFAALPDGPERAALAVALFGKSGADLIPFLIEGKQRMLEYGEQAAATGNVISEEAAAAAGEFNDNLDVLKSIMTGVANEAARVLIPALSGYASEAAKGATNSNVAAEMGRALAVAFRVVAAGAIIAKNVIESQVTMLAFLIDASIGAAKALTINLGGAFRVVANSWEAMKDKGPLEALKAFRDNMAAFAATEGREVAALPGRIRNGISALRDGMVEAQNDIAAAGRLMAGVDGAAAKLGATAASTEQKVGGTTAAGQRLQALLQKLFGDKGNEGKSGAEKKAEKLRRELERLNKEIERSLEKMRADEIQKEEQFRQSVDEAINEHLRESGRSAEAATNEIEAQYRALADRLRNNGDLASALKVEELIDLKKVRANLEQFQNEAQGILNGLQTGEAALSAEGMLGGVEAERQLQDLRAMSLQQLEQLRASVAAYYAETQNPQVLQYLQELDGAIAQVKVSQHELAVTAANVGADALTTLFMDVASGAKKGSEALKDFVRNFVLGMAQIAARALATFLVLQLLDAVYPGLGKATATTMQAGVHHAGGIAGQGGTVRAGLSPLLFGAAPRYHGGGIAGLAPDEVPAVLRRGEEILTEDNPRHRNNAGAGGRTVVKQPIVAIGDRAVADALAGAAGEDVVLTHVRNNWDSLNRGG